MIAHYIVNDLMVWFVDHFISLKYITEILKGAGFSNEKYTQCIK